MAEIILDHVTKRFPDGTVAVDDANLNIQDGEFVILVGPSGCGKSTCLNMIAGLEDITEGQLRIGGRLVNQLSPKDRDIGRDLIVGIRPEDFKDAALLNGRRAEGLTFPAKVDALESLGADKYAYFRLKGPRATAQELDELAADAGTGDAPGGGDQVVARLDPASRAREGHRLQLWFDPARLQLFNPATGAHLTL